MSDCRNNVAGLLKNHKAAGNFSMSFETSSSHMAETVAFKPLERLVIGTNNNFLAINVVAVHPEAVDNGEAFGLYCTVSSFGVGEYATVVGDDPLIIATFLVQNCSNGGHTGLNLGDKLGFAVIHRVAKKR
uniref:Uncharacterized protein n=1 Tax=Romanomermis culicivorax TaxID=13658 RepID=A0A915HU74_ROMCU